MRRCLCGSLIGSFDAACGLLGFEPSIPLTPHTYIHTHIYTGAPAAQRRAVLSSNFEKMMAKRYALKESKEAGNGMGDGSANKKARVEGE